LKKEEEEAEPTNSSSNFIRLNAGILLFVGSIFLFIRSFRSD